LKKKQTAIRAMQVKDLQQVLQIEQQLFVDAWSAEMFRQEIEQKASFVLEFDGQLIGYICGWFLYEEFNLTNLAVATRFQGRGYGKVLVNYLIDYVRQQGFKSIFLEVREFNDAARKLYEKCGFQIAGRRKKYYKNPEEDALLMLTLVKDENER